MHIFTIIEKSPWFFPRKRKPSQLPPPPELIFIIIMHVSTISSRQHRQAPYFSANDRRTQTQSFCRFRLILLTSTWIGNESSTFLSCYLHSHSIHTLFGFSLVYFGFNNIMRINSKYLFSQLIYRHVTVNHGASAKDGLVKKNEISAILLLGY